MNDNLNQLESDLYARIKARGQINIRTLNYDDLLACMDLQFTHNLITIKKTKRGNVSKRFVVINNQ